MQIKQNANRAANLVRQLLAFSRQQTLQPRILDITDVLDELSHLLRRLIGENIELKVLHGRDLGLVKVDQGQLEQVIINLAVNARDAMAGGGTLTIRTANVTQAGADAARPRDDAGRQLCADRGRRYRRRHPQGKSGAHLRTVLLDQGDRLRAPGSACRPSTASSSRPAASSLSTAPPAKARYSRSTCRATRRPRTRRRRRQKPPRRDAGGAI